jgi:antitoxin PrlF
VAQAALIGTGILFRNQTQIAGYLLAASKTLPFADRQKSRCKSPLLLLKCKGRRTLIEAILSSKGQATIPKAVRERLHLKPGDRFKFFFHPDGVIILPKIPTSRLKGIIPKPARPVSLNEIDAAIEAGATQRFRQKK